MQYNKNAIKMKKQPPRAITILSAGLTKYAKQSIRSDAAAIAKNLNISDRTVRPYLDGNVDDIETGGKILAELKKLIKVREQYAKKLAA